MTNSNPKGVEFPKSFGVLLYPQFEVLDVAAPIEALNVLSRHKGYEEMRLSIISKTLDPVSVGPIAQTPGPWDLLGRSSTRPPILSRRRRIWMCCWFQAVTAERSITWWRQARHRRPY